MTLPSRILIKSALFYLVIGALMGMLLLLNKAYTISPQIWSLLPIHIELMIFGWIIQLTLGVAYWILPKYLEGKSRGAVAPAYVMVGFINAGILWTVFTELGWLAPEWKLLGRIFELLAVLIFIALHWKRVVTYNK